MLTSEAISEVSQYDFDMEKLTVYSKHAMLPDNEEECKGIEGLKAIETPFIAVNISPFTEIR